MNAPALLCLHATTIAYEGRGLLIRGASGRGKSALALSLIALGAALVADDQTLVERQGDALIASAPEKLKGLIEARGMGLLRAPPAPPTPLTLVADLDSAAEGRLPPQEHAEILGLTLPLVRRLDHSHFAPALLLHLAQGRYA